MKIRPVLYLFLLVSLSLTFSCSSEEEPGSTGNVQMMDNNNNNDLDEDAPSFSIETTNGDKIESSQFEGKNLVIFFFGFNCPPCKSVGPNIESKLHQAFKDNSNFAIIGADQWEGNNAGVDNFQATTGITFPLGRKGAAMANDFNTTYDRLVVVNAEGKIVFRGNSIASNNLDEVIDIVQGLL